MDTPDTIERELILPVPRARVWAALTEPAGLSAWFGTSVSIDLRPGGVVIFDWDGSTGPRGTNRGVIDVVEPLQRFAFRWQTHAEDPTVPLTRVEFTLEDHPQGTRLRLVESGFASLPPDLRRSSHDDNTQGWARELGELATYLSVHPDQH
ncbi:MAG TPA: SRPBCC domain-containing protein [Chloroflexota bacterium]